MDAHEVLCKARNLIDREGLVKGTLRGQTRWLRRTRGYCVRGAMLEASGVEWVGLGGLYCKAPAEERKRPVLLLAYGVLVSYLPGTPTATDDVARWNNAPERTKAEVLAAFDRAIAATAPPPPAPFPEGASEAATEDRSDWCPVCRYYGTKHRATHAVAADPVEVEAA